MRIVGINTAKINYRNLHTVGKLGFWLGLRNMVFAWAEAPVKDNYIGGTGYN